MCVYWPVPTNFYELQSFLDIVNLNGDFIDKKTALTSSLYDLTAACKCSDPVQFSAGHVEKFNVIKRLLCAAHRLAHLKLETLCTLYKIVLKIAVVQCYFQRDGSGVERAISFFSKKADLGAKKLIFV